MTVNGSILLSAGRHSVWVGTPTRPQGLDLWAVDLTPWHCGGRPGPDLGPCHVANNGFAFTCSVAEGAAEVIWRYDY